jgi:uncharacterized membrane protein
MSGGASIVQESVPHTVNVAIHVAFGTICLLLGVIALMTTKGGRQHIRVGRYFLACLAVVVATAAIGILAFGFRAFLGVITMLAVYEAYSGYRALKIRSTGPQLQDAAVSVAGLGATVLFVAYLRSVHIPWAPVVIYSTLGSLVVIAGYDLARFAFPKHWFQRTWIYEHLVKMLGAYNAIVSAFAGTVLEKWQPYSQMAPSILGGAATLGFIIYVRRHRKLIAIAAI